MEDRESQTRGSHAEFAATSAALHIRRAREDDAATLCAAERETARIPGHLVSLPEEFDEGSFLRNIRELSECGSYLVAERDRVIVGHAFLEPAGHIRGLAHVRSLNIVVHPGFTGQGIGMVLLTTLQDWARSASDVKRIELRVRDGNTAAIGLYKKCGFVEESRFRRRVRLSDGTLIDDVGMVWFCPDENA